MKMQSARILLLGSQHGDELLGERLYGYIKKQHPQLLSHVSYITANPKARRQNVRYIESDMNRSYRKSGKTYEERRGARLLRYIERQKYDLILDLHTTSSNQPPCLIVSDITPEISPFIAATTIEHIVHMQHAFVASSFIGNCRAALSVEVSEHDMRLEDVCQDIKRYIKSQRGKADKHLYVVTDTLRKDEVSPEEIMELENFTRSKKGYYPVLVGEKAYRKHTEYLGFKANKSYKIKL